MYIYIYIFIYLSKQQSQRSTKTSNVSWAPPNHWDEPMGSPSSGRRDRRPRCTRDVPRLSICPKNDRPTNTRLDFPGTLTLVPKTKNCNRIWYQHIEPWSSAFHHLEVGKLACWSLWTCISCLRTTLPTSFWADSSESAAKSGVLLGHRSLVCPGRCVENVGRQVGILGWIPSFQRATVTTWLWHSQG